MIGLCRRVILIDNEQDLWIWIQRIFHRYQCCLLVAISSQVQGAVWFASEHSVAPVIA